MPQPLPFSQTAVRNFDLNIGKILEGWETKHAIRELIANALDEQILSASQDVAISKDSAGLWHIRDFGRGLRYEHLTQNENLEKLQNSGAVIGKFGVGLKDALATLNRGGVAIRMQSCHCEIALTTAAKHGFDDIVTLHATVAPATASDICGTDVELRGVADADVYAAKGFFLRFSNEPILEETQYGQILERRAGGKSRIYVTGLLVAEEERFAFSYNITSLTAAMRKALNRERTNVGRTAYTDRVKAMLLSSKSEVVAELLASDLTSVEKGTQHDEVNWTDIAVHACQVLNARRKVVFSSASELSLSRDAVDHAVSDGFKIVTIPENVRRLISGTRDIQGHPVFDLGVFQQQWSDSFEFQFITREQLSEAERKVFDAWASIAALVGGLPDRVHEIKITETMRPDVAIGQDYHGLWEPTKNRIIVKRSVLNGLDSFSGTLLHEITHARTGYGDVNRDFESALTTVIGQVASACLAD